jgi:hypothetical protein
MAVPRSRLRLLLRRWWRVEGRSFAAEFLATVAVLVGIWAFIILLFSLGV